MAQNTYIVLIEDLAHPGPGPRPRNHPHPRKWLVGARLRTQTEAKHNEKDQAANETPAKGARRIVWHEEPETAPSTTASNELSSLAIPPTAHPASDDAYGLDSVDAIVQALRDLGYAGQPLVLGLPAAWCLNATVSLEGLPRRNWRVPALYRLEEKLPIPAEELSADFARSFGDAFAVACRSEALRQWVEALADRGVTVDHIAPTVLLAIQAFVHPPRGIAEVVPPESPEPPEPPESPKPTAGAPAWDAVVWEEDGLVELLCLREGRPEAWYSLPPEVQDIVVRLRLLALRHNAPLRVAARGVTPATLDALRNEASLILEAVPPLALHEGALRTAVAAADGDCTLWIDLARGDLAGHDRHRRMRRPLLAALTAAVVLLTVTTAGLLYRAHRYEAIAGDYQARQEALFRQLYPSQVVPMAVRSRLESEQRRLRGLSGDVNELTAQPSALQQLHDLLVRLPGELRFRLMEVRLEGQRVYLEGQARSHADAEAIAAALRRQHGFTLEPPRTENLAGQGVAFTLSGTPPTPAMARAEALSPTPSERAGSGLAKQGTPR